MPVVTDLASLSRTVQRWAGGSSEPDFLEAVEEAVGLGEEELNRRLRVPEMIKRVAFQVRNVWTDLPADFLSVDGLWRLDASGREIGLAPTDADRVRLWSGRGGDPAVFAVDGLQLRLAPLVEGTAHNLRLSYWARVPGLSSTNPCTAVLLRYPDLYLYGTLASLAGYLVADERVAGWRALFEQQIAAANLAAARRR